MKVFFFDTAKLIAISGIVHTKTAIKILKKKFFKYKYSSHKLRKIESLKSNWLGTPWPWSGPTRRDLVKSAVLPTTSPSSFDVRDIETWASGSPSHPKILVRNISLSVLLCNTLSTMTSQLKVGSAPPLTICPSSGAKRVVAFTIDATARWKHSRFFLHHHVFNFMMYMINDNVANISDHYWVSCQWFVLFIVFALNQSTFNLRVFHKWTHLRRNP